ncbi:MAG TPA: hypothetical protein VKT33_05585 [Candidatus Angelobacter sp.]|nr:hypothetical protein [Candidatus Angelobacter sp.]
MPDSKINSFQSFTIALIILCCSLCAAGQQLLQGNVVDGSSRKPAGGDEVVLLRVENGIGEEARATSDAGGVFSFQLADSRAQHAVRVTHQGVAYYQPVAPGSASVSVTIYDSEAKVPGLRQTSHSVVLQAKGAVLNVIEIFNLRNESQHTQPNFSFSLPGNATIGSGEAVRSDGLRLKGAPARQGDGKYAFQCPLLPGLTHFEVVYTLPYKGDLKFQPQLAGPVDKFYVITPKSLGFTPVAASQYQISQDAPIQTGSKDVDVYVASGAGRASQLAFNLAGEGTLQPVQPSRQPMLTAKAATNANPPGSTIEKGQPRSAGIENRHFGQLNQGQWIFVGIVVLFLLIGGAAIIVKILRGDAEVSRKMAGLKEEIFRLNADRVAGRINHKDYVSAKLELDLALQRALKSR